MDDRDNLHRLSPGELVLIRSYRRLNPEYQGFMDRMIDGAAGISTDVIHPPNNVIPFVPVLQVL